MALPLLIAGAGFRTELVGTMRKIRSVSFLLCLTAGMYACGRYGSGIDPDFGSKGIASEIGRAHV